MDKKVAGQLKKFEKEFDSLVEGEDMDFDMGPFIIHVNLGLCGSEVEIVYLKNTIKDGHLTKEGTDLLNTLFYSDDVMQNYVEDFASFNDNCFYDAMQQYNKKVKKFDKKLSDFCKKSGLSLSGVYNDFQDKYALD